MLSEISHRKTNTASFHVYVEPKNSEPGRYREQTSFPEGEGEGRVQEVREEQRAGLHALSLWAATRRAPQQQCRGVAVTQGASASGHPSVSVKRPSHRGMNVYIHDACMYVSGTSFRESQDERRSGKTVR